MQRLIKKEGLKNPFLGIKNANVAQLVEHDLAKVGVAGSSPVSRSKRSLDDYHIQAFKYKTYNFILHTHTS